MSGESVSWDAEVPITKIYRNNGDNTFSDQTSIPLAQCSGTCAWGDYDNDGDLDFILSGRLEQIDHRITKIYRNDGNNTFTEQTAIPIVGLESSSVSWGDYDNDGDLDILISGWTGSPSLEALTKIYRNNGNSSFTEQSIPLIGVYGMSSSKWVDYDNDGDLDIF